MAEEEKNEEKPRPAIARKVVVPAVTVLVAVVLGLAAFKFVFAPMFKEPEEQGEEVTNKIPVTAMMADFDKLQASVRTDTTGGGPALLQYSVTLVCANGPTSILVQENTQWFRAMLVRLHDGHTQDDLTDPVAKESRLRRAKNDANALLTRLQEEEIPDIEIIDVMYTEYTVIEL